jgi:hypothetical protein
MRARTKCDNKGFVDYSIEDTKLRKKKRRPKGVSIGYIHP